jgi:hypothetical protein
MESEIARRLLNNSEKDWIISGGLDKRKKMSDHGKHKNNLYYLLPGMGHGARKRFWRNLFLGVLVGILASGLMALLFWFSNNR